MLFSLLYMKIISYQHLIYGINDAIHFLSGNVTIIINVVEFKCPCKISCQNQHKYKWINTHHTRSNQNTYKIKSINIQYYIRDQYSCKHVFIVSCDMNIVAIQRFTIVFCTLHSLKLALTRPRTNYYLNVVLNPYHELSAFINNKLET